MRVSEKIAIADKRQRPELNHNIDPLGRLDTITTSSTTAKFQYDGANISTELNASNVITRRYVWGAGDDEVLVQYDGAAFATRRYLVADERGRRVLSAFIGTAFAQEAAVALQHRPSTQLARLSTSGTRRGSIASSAHRFRYAPPSVNFTALIVRSALTDQMISDTAAVSGAI